jgi:hypothetical protein
MLTNEKQQAMDQIDGDWKILNNSQVEKLVEILKILNRYYKSLNRTSEGMTFRERSCEEGIKKAFKIKKFGQYEYLIYATLNDTEEDSWIHIDGIAEERKLMLERGIDTHPVFNITCLQDIYEGEG